MRSTCTLSLLCDPTAAASFYLLCAMIHLMQAADALVTGTLGLAGGPTAEAMRQAVAAAREVRVTWAVWGLGCKGGLLHSGFSGSPAS